jgi:hypothetical protein
MNMDIAITNIIEYITRIRQLLFCILPPVSAIFAPVLIERLEPALWAFFMVYRVITVHNSSSSQALLLFP